jgi:hypothetical protein
MSIPTLQPRPGQSVPPARASADPWVSLCVLLLALTVAGLVLGGVLAIYDWTTPGAERPLFFAVLGTFLAALVIPAVTGAARWARAVIR